MVGMCTGVEDTAREKATEARSTSFPKYDMPATVQHKVTP